MVNTFFLTLLVWGWSTPIFLDENWESDFIRIDKKYDIFYWLFKSRLNTPAPPLILWLPEGPGCSSAISVLTENGPYRISEDLNLTYNSFSWNNYADVIYIDQPLGTGFTTCEDESRIPRTELEIAQDLESFLNLFLKKYYEYYGRRFYIAGRSYGGHYVPFFAKYLLDKEFDSLRLKGIAIGNGLFDYTTQMQSYPIFSYEHGFINSFTYAGSALVYQISRTFIGLGLNKMGYLFLNIGNAIIRGVKKNFNIYDIRKECIGKKSSQNVFEPICYNYTNLINFMKRKDVLEELNVGNRTWQMCSSTVFKRMLDEDVFADMTPVMEDLLNRKNPIRIALFNGIKDWFCNNVGMKYFLQELKWPGQGKLKADPFKSWYVSGRKAGSYKTIDFLSYYEVEDAGHIVSADQPECEYDILTRLIYP